MKDYSELKHCAEKATQGEWWIDSHGHTLVAHTSEGTKIVFRTDDSMGPATRHAETGNLSHWPNDWDASYIVTANPATVQDLIAEVEALRESNDKLTRRNGMLEQNVKVMTETHVLYTWLRKNVDQPSNDFVAVHMNIGHDWTPVHDLDRDLRGMIEREEP